MAGSENKKVMAGPRPALFSNACEQWQNWAGTYG